MSSLMSEENISQTSNVCPATLLFLLDHHTFMRSSSGTLKGSHPEVAEFSQPIEDHVIFLLMNSTKSHQIWSSKWYAVHKALKNKLLIGNGKIYLVQTNSTFKKKKTLFLFKTLRYVRKLRIWNQGMFDTMLQLWLKCIGLISCRLWCHVVSC